MDILKPCAIALAVSILPYSANCSKASPHQYEAKCQWDEIDMKGLEELLNFKILFSFVDAHSDKYFDDTLIIGTEWLPYGSKIPIIEKTFPDKKKLIVVYYGGGKRPPSNNLAKRLIQMGYANVIDYHGSIREWEDNNKSVKQIQS